MVVLLSMVLLLLMINIYNKASHTLTVNLDDVLPYQSLLLSFVLRKRINTFFVLNNLATLHTESGVLIKSNTVTVVSPIIRRNYNNFWYDAFK